MNKTSIFLLFAIFLVSLLPFLRRSFFTRPRPPPPPPPSPPPRLQSSTSPPPAAAMDTFYISHGSPMLGIDDSLPARHFLKSWKEKIFPETPRAILMVSAHWDASQTSVNVIDGPTDTIYDFYGFPKPLYKLKYPAPGAPDLAKRVKALLQDAGFGPVKEDKKRGLDHGAWVPLLLMYPEANIPVCQLSVEAHKDAEYHYKMGKALTPLREEGVLIIGSGSATHNLGLLGPDGTPTPKWALDFDNWLTKTLLDGRYEDVNNYLEKAPLAKKAHPWPEHFYPLHVALGAAGETAKSEIIHESWTNGGLSTRREKALAYAFSQQLRTCTAKRRSAKSDATESSSVGWSWLERWMAARQQESSSVQEANSGTQRSTIIRHRLDMAIEEKESCGSNDVSVNLDRGSSPSKTPKVSRIQSNGRSRLKVMTSAPCRKPVPDYRCASRSNKVSTRTTEGEPEKGKRCKEGGEPKSINEMKARDAYEAPSDY